MTIPSLQALSSAATLPLPTTQGSPATATPSGQFNFQIPKSIEFQPSTKAPQPLSSLGLHEPTTFGHLMQQTVRDVNQVQKVAGEKVLDVLQGGATPVHEAMIAVEESSVAFTMLTEMRNKLLDSYQEVMRIPV